jgi:ATP-binding cassette, subfamily B, bacterial
MSRPWVRRLVEYTRTERRRLATLFLLAVASAGLEALRPWPLKYIVDGVLVGEPLPEAVRWIGGLPGGASAVGLLGWLTFATVALFFAGAMSRAASAYVESGVTNRMGYRLGRDVFLRAQQRSIRSQRQQHTGDLVTRVMSDSDCASDVVVKSGLPLLSALATLGAMFGFMWSLDRSLALLALMVAPLLGVTVRVFAGRMAARTYDHLELQGQIVARAEQVLSGLPVVRAFHRESQEDDRFRDLWRRGDRAYLRSTLSQTEFRLAVDVVSALGMAAVMGLGGLIVLRGDLSVGGLLVFLSYVSSLYAPLETIAYLSQGLATAAARGRRVDQVLDDDDLIGDAPDARPLPPRSTARGAHVRFEEVQAGYEPGQPVLTSLSLDVRPGESIALVGATGAGKSTLVSLIPRFLDPWHGRVLFDGIDIRQIRLSSLREQVSLVLQDPFLLPVSVAENIAYGRPHAARHEIEAAAEAAEADGFIARLPHGYDTVLGERGATLSVGERQRLSFARALLRDAPILILDEPTSALDAHTEAAVTAALQRLLARRTTFLIAHRLSTIRHVNRIVVLDQGRIVEDGSHADLLARGGIYADYYRRQAGESALGLDPGGAPCGPVEDARSSAQATGA